jgi:hypothetical protein
MMHRAPKPAQLHNSLQGGRKRVFGKIGAPSSVTFNMQGEVHQHSRRRAYEDRSISQVPSTGLVRDGKDLERSSSSDTEAAVVTWKKQRS